MVGFLYPASHPDKRPGTHVSGYPRWGGGRTRLVPPKATKTAGRSCFCADQDRLETGYPPGAGHRGKGREDSGT